MADYISRHPVHSAQQRNLSEEYVNFITLETLPHAIELDDVKRATLHDATIQKAIELARNGNWHTMKNLRPDSVDREELTAISSVREELTVHCDNVLLRGSRIILPKALRERAIHIAHEGHQGMAKTKAFLRSKVWFPGMDGRVENFIMNCSPCQLLSPERHTMEPLQMSELPGGPWENLSIYFCGPLPRGEYLFVIIDEYTRYPIVEIVKSVSAKSTIPTLDKVISMFGIPRVIKSDNGSPFQSHEFRNYAEHIGFIHRRITPRWPRANSQAESFNKPLMKAIRSANIDGLHWRQEVYKFLRQYRATPHVSTGKSPFELMFNRNPKTRLPAIIKKEQTPVDLQVRERDSQKKYQMRVYAESRNCARPRDICVGDAVVMKREDRGNKLQPKYLMDPKVVTDKKGSMVTVDGHTTRNSSNFKKINPKVQAELMEKVWNKEDFNEEIELGNSSNLKSESIGKPLKTTNNHVAQPRRSQRQREIPRKLQDYVLSKK